MILANELWTNKNHWCQIFATKPDQYVKLLFGFPTNLDMQSSWVNSIKLAFKKSQFDLKLLLQDKSIMNDNEVTPTKLALSFLRSWGIAIHTYEKNVAEGSFIMQAHYILFNKLIQLHNISNTPTISQYLKGMVDVYANLKKNKQYNFGLIGRLFWMFVCGFNDFMQSILQPNDMLVVPELIKNWQPEKNWTHKLELLIKINKCISALSEVRSHEARFWQDMINICELKQPDIGISMTQSKLAKINQTLTAEFNYIVRAIDEFLDDKQEKSKLLQRVTQDLTQLLKDIKSAIPPDQKQDKSGSLTKLEENFAILQAADKNTPTGTQKFFIECLFNQLQVSQAIKDKFGMYFERLKFLLNYNAVCRVSLASTAQFIIDAGISYVTQKLFHKPGQYVSNLKSAKAALMFSNNIFQCNKTMVMNGIATVILALRIMGDQDNNPIPTLQVKHELAQKTVGQSINKIITDINRDQCGLYSKMAQKCVIKCMKEKFNVCTNADMFRHRLQVTWGMIVERRLQIAEPVFNNLNNSWENDCITMSKRYSALTMKTNTSVFDLENVDSPWAENVDLDCQLQTISQLDTMKNIKNQNSNCKNGQEPHKSIDSIIDNFVNTCDKFETSPFIIDQLVFGNDGEKISVRLNKLTAVLKSLIPNNEFKNQPSNTTNANDGTKKTTIMDGMLSEEAQTKPRIVNEQINEMLQTVYQLLQSESWHNKTIDFEGALNGMTYYNILIALISQNKYLATLSCVQDWSINEIDIDKIRNTAILLEITEKIINELQKVKQMQNQEIMISCLIMLILTGVPNMKNDIEKNLKAKKIC